MESYLIKPILGLKNNVPWNDPSLFVAIGQNAAITYCVEGTNVQYKSPQNACQKSSGRLRWSNSATTTTTNCLGLFEFYDGTNRAYFAFMGDGSNHGAVYRYDSSRDPQQVEDAGSTEWADDDDDIYCIVQIGDYMIFCDNGDHTPMKCDHNDATLTKLITAGGATEYKFKYLEEFQRRIIGAYSDQTNGDIEIRWTTALPNFADLEFTATNQLYIPNDDSITGIKRMGFNACFIYSEDSIQRIDYYPSYTNPFGISNAVNGQGSANYHSIVDVGGRHFLFNKNYGFCEYHGTSEFPYGGKPISEAIEDEISSMSSSYYYSIVGKYVPQTNEIAWLLPLNGSNTPNTIAFYNIFTQQWRFETKSARYIDVWTLSPSSTWTNYVNLGYTTWQDLIDAGFEKWRDLFSLQEYLVMSGADGHTYYDAGTNDIISSDGSYNGYRVEPVMDFGNPLGREILKEIWFDLSETGDYSIYCQYRGGDTVGEVKNSTWTSLPSISCDNPKSPVSYIPDSVLEANTFHQLKWGNATKGSRFAVSSIKFMFEPAGIY